MPARFNALMHANRLKAAGMAAGPAEAQANALFQVLASHRRDIDGNLRRALGQFDQRLSSGLQRLSDDVARIDGRVSALQTEMEKRFCAVDQRFVEFEAKVDRRFAESDAKMDKRLAVFEAKTTAQFNLLHWMLAFLLTGMSAVLIRLFV